MKYLKKIIRLCLVIIGVILKTISSLFPINKNIWIFGAQDGKDFVENSKYLYLYILKANNDVTPIWITKNKSIISSIRQSGGKAYYNYSIRGLYFILTAGCYIFSTNTSDVLYCFKRKGRVIINLWHGMPIKKIVCDYNKMDELLGNSFVHYIWEKYVVGFKFEDVNLIASTSEFFRKILISSFRNERVYTIGQPRNDAFFSLDKASIKKKLNVSGKYVITYMPTHRAYGKGKLNPKLFVANNKAKDFFVQNNIIFFIKYHKNMNFSDNLNISGNDIIRDISKSNCDPQEVLLATDTLISDYSSCLIDYLILDKPIILYQYDNYEQDDNEVYFRIKDYNIGPISHNEEELLNSIKKLFINVPQSKYNRGIANGIFNTYSDGNNSERVYQKIIELLS